MDKDRIRGTGKKIAGSIKEAVGKITGNKKLENEGKAEKAGGKVQKGVGDVKDTVRGKRP